MKARLVFVPPGGGEADYSLLFDLPGVPQAGDYISIQRGEEPGTEDFIVRRTWWHLNTPETRAAVAAEDERMGEIADLVVECEFAVGHYSHDDHKAACARCGAGSFDASTH